MSDCSGESFDFWFGFFCGALGMFVVIVIASAVLGWI